MKKFPETGLQAPNVAAMVVSGEKDKIRVVDLNRVLIGDEDR